jgi:hypothetical protein
MSMQHLWPGQAIRPDAWIPFCTGRAQKMRIVMATRAPTSAPAVAAKGSTHPFFDGKSLLRDITNIDTKERLPNARCNLGHRTIRRDSGHAHFSLLVDS